MIIYIHFWDADSESGIQFLKFLKFGLFLASLASFSQFLIKWLNCLSNFQVRNKIMKRSSIYIFGVLIPNLVPIFEIFKMWLIFSQF